MWSLLLDLWVLFASPTLFVFLFAAGGLILYGIKLKTRNKKGNKKEKEKKKIEKRNQN